MSGFRAERIAGRIHEEVAARLARDIKDPNLEVISITRVEVTRDLRRAVIEYLPLGGGLDADLAERLSNIAKQLRGPVGRALGIRHAPELVFQIDTHTEAAVRVTGLLDRIGRELRGDPPPGEATADEGEDEGESEAEEGKE